MKTEPIKILILVPDKNAKGGITNYYQSIKKHFTARIDYFTRGSRNWPERKNPILELYRLFSDYWSFFLIIRREKYTLVQTTSDFDSLSLVRDSIFLLIAKLYGCKLIAFFRGWNPGFVSKMTQLNLFLIRSTYFKTNAIIDLSETNKMQLISWGFTKDIYIETTLVDNDLLIDIDEKLIREKIKNKYLNQSFNILYLGRIEISKGIYEIVDTYEILKNRYRNISLTIAGDGFEIENIKNYTLSKSLLDVHFPGFVSGEKKKTILENADIFLFPSHYEGMPNSVLEAMAFGLPVVTTSVGGLSDFFISGVNGYITESRDPKELSLLMTRIIDDEWLFTEIAINNYIYAKTHFTADIVASRIETIYNNVFYQN